MVWLRVRAGSWCGISDKGHTRMMEFLAWLHCFSHLTRSLYMVSALGTLQ